MITIGRIFFNELSLPCIDVIHHHWWTGRSHLEQYAAVIALIAQWGIRSLVIDATGLGAGLASLLLSKFGADRIVPFTFSRPAKSRLAYQMLALLNAGRLKLYAPAIACPPPKPSISTLTPPMDTTTSSLALPCSRKPPNP